MCRLKRSALFYERWVRAMKDRKIDITELFGYDPGMLSAAQHDDWFIENTEPRPGEHYKPVKEIEEMMGQFVCQWLLCQSSR